MAAHPWAVNAATTAMLNRPSFALCASAGSLRSNAGLARQPKLRQVDQRVTARYHLLPLSREETHAYVRHRMAVAGRADRVFTDGAVRAVYRLSRGIPRLINVICDRALLGAYTRDRSRVDGATARRAAAEVLGRRTGWLSGYCSPEVDQLIEQQSIEADQGRRKQLLWAIERKLAEDGARPIIFYDRRATCWNPHVKGLTLMVNSLFNGWRMEDVWLDK